MANLMREFNEKILNYIKVCAEQGEVIDCYEESYLLTEEKCILIYNQIIKERRKQKDSSSLKMLLEELKRDSIEFNMQAKEQLPNYNDSVIEYAKICIFEYRKSDQNKLISSYRLGCALTNLKEKYRNRVWEETIQAFFKENRFKMKSSAEKNLRKFYSDIGQYHRLLYIQKSYTELRRILPRILDAFKLYPEEKSYWLCPDDYICDACRQL